MDELNTRKVMEAWLKTQARETSIVIAGRAALRMLPFLAARSISKEVFNSVHLPIFRALSLSLAISRHSQNTKILRPDDALDGVRRASNYERNGVARAAVVAAVAAAITYAASSADSAFVAHAASDAVYAAGFAAAATPAAIAATYTTTDAAAADAKFLIEGSGPVSLAKQPLWLSDPRKGFRRPPQEFHRLWMDLRDQLFLAAENWDVWIRWYEAILEGRPTPGGAELDIYRVTLESEADWKKGSAHVNALIMKKEEEIAGRSDSQKSAGATQDALKTLL